MAETKEEFLDDELFTSVYNTDVDIMPEIDSALHNTCNDHVTVAITKKETNKYIK